jgi:hypothetical protein
MKEKSIGYYYKILYSLILFLNVNAIEYAIVV